jgi:hypothetical protein
MSFIYRKKWELLADIILALLTIKEIILRFKSLIEVKKAINKRKSDVFLYRLSYKQLNGLCPQIIKMRCSLPSPIRGNILLIDPNYQPIPRLSFIISFLAYNQQKNHGISQVF